MIYYMDYERVSHHKSMISDAARTEAFKKAIEKTVRANDTVVDLGAGTGVLSFFAVHAGAGNVYAIERTGIIRLAERIAKLNGVNNISFIHEDSRKVRLAEKCDVLVSECIGYFALQENMVSDFLEFRKRFLKKGGRVIPQRLELYLVPVSSQEAYEQVSFWGQLYGIDFLSVRDVASNSVYQLNMTRSCVMAKPRLVKVIDMRKDDGVSLDTNVSFRADRTATLHGLCGYFKMMLCEGVTLTNSPGTQTHWKSQFFPLSAPLYVKKGEKIDVWIKAIPHRNFVDWEWVAKAGGRTSKRSTKDGIRLKER